MSSENPVPAPSTAARSAARRALLPPSLKGSLFLVALAIPWAALLWHLSEHWSSNLQYSYGWLVPPLSALLVYRSWSNRPRPAPVRSPLLLLVIALSAFVCGPIWLVAQANPGWRAVSWSMALAVVALSFWCITLGFGKSSARHFLFPLLFVLTAIPWPSGLEAVITQSLMRLVTSITVEILNALGIVAVATGNIIETASGPLGVDQACSGIRSLQGALMVSIFLGELLYLRRARRVGLVCITVLAAFSGNVIRATTLGFVTARSGIQALERWHDPAGFTILVFCFLVSGSVAFRWGSVPRIPRREQSHFSPGGFPLGVSGALVAWWISVAVFTECWYREPEALPPITWQFSTPEGATDIQKLSIPEIAEEMLRYDDAVARVWTDPQNHRWFAYFFSWNAGPVRSCLLARMHTPQTCLPAQGLSITESGRHHLFDTHGESLSFDLYRFAEGTGSAYVFYAAWEQAGERPIPASLDSTSVVQASLQAVRNRRRNLSQHVLEMIVSGCASEEEADAEFRELLPLVLKPKSSGR